MGICIMQVLIYIHLLTITCLHNKAAVVTKLLVKLNIKTIVMYLVIEMIKVAKVKRKSYHVIKTVG